MLSEVLPKITHECKPSPIIQHCRLEPLFDFRIHFKYRFDATTPQYRYRYNVIIDLFSAIKNSGAQKKT